MNRFLKLKISVNHQIDMKKFVRHMSYADLFCLREITINEIKRRNK